MTRVVSLESIEEARTERVYGSATNRWYQERAVTNLMRAERLGSARRCRASKGTMNQDLLSRSPGCSTNTGLDFVRAVYAEKTGQE